MSNGSRLLIIALLLGLVGCSDGMSASSALRDHVVLKGGKTLAVNIESFRNDVLTVIDEADDKKTFARPELQSLQFEVQKQPPTTKTMPGFDSDKDLIFLRDGSVKLGRVLTITAHQVTTQSARFVRTAVYQIVIANDGGGMEPKPPDTMGFGDAPERCIRDVKAHFKHVQAYGNDWLEQLKAARSKQADGYAIGVQMKVERAAIDQVERLYRDQFGQSREAFKAVLKQAGHAGGYSEAVYQHMRQTMYNLTLSQCIQVYFIITESWIGFDLHFAMHLPFWAQVMQMPLPGFAQEQGDLLRRADMDERGFDVEDIARPPLMDFLDSDREELETWERALNACGNPGSKACFDRADAAYCQAHLQYRNHWVKQTKQRFNDIAVKYYDGVAAEWLRRNLKRVLDARAFALPYRDELRLRDETMKSGDNEWNEAKQTYQGLNQGYGNLLNHVMPDVRGVSLSNVPIFISDQEKFFAELREGRERDLKQRAGSASQTNGCGDVGANTPVRLLKLTKEQLTQLSDQIRKLKPDLDAPVSITIAE